MAKKSAGEGEGEGEAEDWTPDQPIPDEEGEAEAQRRFMLDRRVKQLNEEADKKVKKPKKKGLWS